MAVGTVQPSPPMGSSTHGDRETMGDWATVTSSTRQNQNRYVHVCGCMIPGIMETYYVIMTSFLLHNKNDVIMRSCEDLDVICGSPM